MAIAFFDYVAALRESDLPGPARSVAFWIASRCANGWPVTRETVAADSGFSRATVTRAISELREKGWLVSDRNRRQGNSYQVSIPRLLSAQSEPKEAQSEPLKKSLSAQSEPTVGSERAYKKAQSEPTYIRTIQEQQEHPRACARTTAREGDAATIKHSDLNQPQLWGWVRELEKDPDAKAEVLKSEFYRTSTGEIRKDAFVTALLYDEQVFERFRPLFERMKAEGRL